MKFVAHGDRVARLDTVQSIRALWQDDNQCCALMFWYPGGDVFYFANFPKWATLWHLQKVAERITWWGATGMDGVFYIDEALEKVQHEEEPKE